MQKRNELESLTAIVTAWNETKAKITKIEGAATKRAVDGDLVRTVKAMFFEKVAAIIASMEKHDDNN